LLKGFDEIFWRFFESPVKVEAVGVGSSGMAVYFDPVAVSLAGEGGDMVFQLAADAEAPGGVFDCEVADPRKIAGQGDLGDEVKGKESDHFELLFVDEQEFIGVIGHADQPLFEKGACFGIAQLCE